jgi:hypothetical protein
MAELGLTIIYKKGLEHIDLIQQLSPAYNLQAGDVLHLSIVFPGYLVHAENLLIVASFINFLRGREVIVEIETHGDSTYASRVDFYKLIDVPFEEKYIRRDSTGRFIELKPFNENTLYGIQDELNMVLYQKGTIAKEILQLLSYCICEIMDNILVHSGLNSGWIAAQYYPAAKEIRLTVCDYGEGIHHSLTHQDGSKYKDASEAEALDLCIQRGVTNGKGLGFGLFATSQFILKNGGDLLLYSGNHYLLAQGGDYSIKQGEFCQGTFVSLRINTENPVDYKEIMPKNHSLPDDYDFFIDKFFGEDNELW